MSKERIAAVVTQATNAEQAQPLLAMKKAQAAAAVEELLVGNGWVPELMRGQSLLSNSRRAPRAKRTNNDPAPPGNPLAGYRSPRSDCYVGRGTNSSLSKYSLCGIFHAGYNLSNS